MIKIGIVGLGHMGGYHASVATTLPGIELVGVADPHQKNLAKITQSSVIKTHDFNDWIDLVDAVIIAVQTNNHYAVAKAFLERGKHVLVEKPLTKVLTQAEELFALAQENNVTLHIGHVERFNGAVQELKKIINQPLLIECHRMGPFVARAARDSVVLDLMIHDIDLVLNLVNEAPIKISAHGAKIHSASCDIATAQLTFASGCVASFVVSRASQVKKRTMAVHQQNATLNLDFGTQDLMIHRQASSSVQVGTDQLQYRQESLIEHVFVYKDNPLKLEIMHFMTAIEQDIARRSAKQDLQALAIIFEIERQLGLRPEEIPFITSEQTNIAQQPVTI
jgi:predicted dehydrogenase